MLTNNGTGFAVFDACSLCKCPPCNASEFARVRCDNSDSSSIVSIVILGIVVLAAEHVGKVILANRRAILIWVQGHLTPGHRLGGRSSLERPVCFSVKDESIVFAPLSNSTMLGDSSVGSAEQGQIAIEILDFPAAATDDPAAQLLAREQSALDDLDEDFAFSKEPQAVSDAGETKDELFSATSESDIKVNGDFSNGDFVNQANGDAVNNGLPNDVSELSLNGSLNNKQDSGIGQSIRLPEEPESIEKWREEHKQALEAKDADEKTKIAERDTGAGGRN